MEKKLVNSQITSWNTYMHVLRRMTLLAANVFLYENFPEEIDLSYFTQTLLKNGSIAFFYDDVMKTVLALPYTPVGKMDVYGRPKEIMVRAYNGTYYRRLKKGEFVIMYDNTGRYSILLDICQMAERVARNEKTIDVNLSQQRTPRIWVTTSDKIKTVKDMSDRIDGFEENVIGYDSIDLEETQGILAPAPYVSDKIRDENNTRWADFYSFIGIANLTEVKRERVIKDEIQVQQGGTIAARNIRLKPREDAIKEINKKWGDKMGKEIKVIFYDGLPSNLESEEDRDELSMDDNTNGTVYTD